MANSDFIKMAVLLLVVVAMAIFVIRGMPGRWYDSDGDFLQTFLSNVGKQNDSVWGFGMKETLSRIVTAWLEKGCSAVILSGPDEKGVKGHQVIELETGPRGPGKVEGIPTIKAKWTRATDQEQAKAMVRRRLKHEAITCTDETFAQFMKHLVRCPVVDKKMLPNGQITFDGYLSPVPR